MATSFHSWRSSESEMSDAAKFWHCISPAAPCFRTHQHRQRCPRLAASPNPMRSPSLQSVEAEPLPVASTDSVTTGVPSARVLRNYEVSLFDALKFSGPAPHIINMRLAMLGLLWGAKVEAQTGNTITQQAQSRPVAIAAVVALTTIASLIPIMKGVKSEAFGRFSPKAEVINGRLACLGFAALLILESKAKVPFF